jgi:hypothetical protein
MKDDQKEGQHRSKGWEVLKRVKSKKHTKEAQPEAERLFFLFFPEASHWKAPSILLPFDPITYVPYLKQTALAILGTGIIGENGLRGHARHKGTFPVDQRDLIGALVDTHYKYSDVTFFPADIIKHFDNSFDSMAAMASMGGVRDKELERKKKEWREKISLAVGRGKFPDNWREIAKVDLISSRKYQPKSEAQAFAIVFLQYAPQAPDNRIAIWTNTILKSLGQDIASISHLREYIKKERQRRPYLPRKSSHKTS